MLRKQALLGSLCAVLYTRQLATIVMPAVLPNMPHARHAPYGQVHHGNAVGAACHEPTGTNLAFVSLPEMLQTAAIAIETATALARSVVPSKAAAHGVS